MDFNFKLDSGGSSATAELRKYAKNLLVFWRKIKTPLFVTFFFSVVAFGGYIWKKSLYGGGWDEAKKQEYINTQNKSVVFKEDDFKKVIENVKERRETNVIIREDLKDIFKKY